MTRFGWVQDIYLRHFSKPKHERVLYRELRKQMATRIVELGIGSLERSTRIIRSIRKYQSDSVVSYAGIDHFESRTTDRPRIALKDTYRTLSAAGAKARLIPGDPLEVLSRYANVLTDTDFMIISAEVSPESLAPCWFYVPRMLKNSARVFVEVGSHGARAFQMLTYSEVVSRADAATSARRAAA